MKDPHATTQLELPHPKPSVPAGDNHQITAQGNSTIIVGLMVPVMMVILNLTMFDIALPTIRDMFQLQADVVAWLVTAYAFPFMVAMPLYGRLGDELGKRRLFLAGILIFLLGTIIVMSAASLQLLILGRIIQGFGASGVVPLCIALISQIFPAAERGNALGTWNSAGPVTAIVAPVLAGMLIDHLNWRVIFGPILLAAVAAIVVVRSRVPVQTETVRFTLLRSFDWLGAILLALAATFFMFYLSSPIITGVPVLLDWRFLLAALLFFGAFIIAELRHQKPYIDLNIFSNNIFSRASTCSGIRMFSMSNVAFLGPLYLTDIHGLSAASTGAVLMLHAGALLLTMRLGGQLADRWNGRWPIMVGLLVQGVVLLCLGFLPGDTPLWIIVIAVVFHGLSAGLSLAALHRASMSTIPLAQTGTAAGIYSMIRFGGMVLGPAISGVILQHSLDRALLPIEAYQTAFWFVAAVVALGTVMSWGLKE